MSEFSGKSFGARKQVAVANNAGANSGAKSEHYEIVETGGGKLIEDNKMACQIEGIGIGAPCANAVTGCIEAATDLPWPSPIPLANMIEMRLGLNVVISNDANAAAIGEMTYGAAAGLDNFIVLTLGTGVVSGIVCDGFWQTS